MFEFPILIGDIGGTNARFAVLSKPKEPLILLRRCLTADFPGPVEAIRAALADVACKPPRAALLAVAARVDAPVVRLTNAAWTIDAGAIGSMLRLRRVALVNDFAPVAAALPALCASMDALTPIGPSLGPASGPRLVLGPGTGFGAAALLPAGDNFVLHTTEAGHVDFGPASEHEARLWPHMASANERISAETVLSGPGLLRLYNGLAKLNGVEPHCLVPKDVIERGVAEAEPLAASTLRLFARLLGRYAGDLALLFGASGGVFIAGGIAPKIAACLDRGGFREAFERKPPYEALMRAIPTSVITHPDPALEGLSALACKPERFLFQAQVWPPVEAPHARPKQALA